MRNCQLPLPCTQGRGNRTSAFIRQHILYRIGDVVRQLARAPEWHRVSMTDIDGKGPAFSLDDRTIAEKLCHRLNLKRRRHDNQDQVFAHGLANLAKHGDGQIGMHASFVEFITSTHGPDVFEKRIVQKLAGEDAFGEDAQPGLRTDALFRDEFGAPTSPPRLQWFSSAMRAALARAATRRG